MQTGKFVILIMLTFAAFSAAAVADATTLTTAEMKGIFHDLTSKDAPWPPEQLQVDSFQAQPATMLLPAGKREYRSLSRQHPKYLGRKTVKLAVMVNGKEIGIIKMSGDLHLYGEIACTTRSLDRYETVTANDIKMVRRDISMLGDDLIQQPTDIIGKRLTTSLQPGDILRAAHLDEPPLVKRGDMVTIVAQTPGLRATAPGEAKKTGAKGDIIRVKNLMSRKYIFAKVIAAGVVQVKF